ncbi:hypothetical protein, partial [Ralstonia solanacearum]|uniref:hypothetical protein n=1 Tax=Ralstonia solanacearum TaxID=305 RepID=UPI001E3DEAED
PRHDKLADADSGCRARRPAATGSGTPGTGFANPPPSCGTGALAPGPGVRLKTGSYNRPLMKGIACR